MRETPIGDRLQDRPVARRPRVRTHPVGFPARMGMRQTPGFLRVSTHSTHVLQTFHRAWTKNPQEKLLWKKIRSMRSEPYKCWGFGRYLSVLFARGCVLPAAHPRHVSSRAGRRLGPALRRHAPLTCAFLPRSRAAQAVRMRDDPSGAATAGSDWTSSGAGRGSPQPATGITTSLPSRDSDEP